MDNSQNDRQAIKQDDLKEPSKKEFWIKEFIVFKTHPAHADSAEVREAYNKPAPNRPIHVISADYHEWKTKRLMEIIEMQKSVLNKVSTHIPKGTYMTDVDAIYAQRIAELAIEETTQLLEGLTHET